MITDDADTILNAERIILPGVGAFGNAMAQLEKTGLDEVIREAVEISHIRQSGKARNTCYVFEGFMDYLSFLTLRQESCPNYPELDGQDYIVLNSVSNVNKALYPLGLKKASSLSFPAVLWRLTRPSA